jgi:hypothetical protein
VGLIAVKQGSQPKFVERDAPCVLKKQQAIKEALNARGPLSLSKYPQVNVRHQASVIDALIPRATVPTKAVVIDVYQAGKGLTVV